MTDVRPFTGLRYNLARSGGAQTMAQLLAPPYDVIDAQKREALIAANPYNVVRLELPEGEDRYDQAARLLGKWVSEGILVQDEQPSFYIYDEEVPLPDGSKATCRAIFAAVRLYDWADNVIMPHESTMIGPKADRLALLQATRVNLSPVFSVYNDADGAVDQAVNQGLATNTQVESSAGQVETSPDRGKPGPVQVGFAFVDNNGNRCQLTPIVAPEAVAEISAAFDNKRLYIADGHHRYETALNYRNEQRAKKGGSDGSAPAEFVLMALTAINDPGLQILPTHRVVTGISNESRTKLDAYLAKHFAVEHYSQGANPAQAIARLMFENRGDKHIFGAYGLQQGKISLLRLKDAGPMADIEEHSAAWRELDVAILQKVILQDGLGITEQILAAGNNVTYIKDPAEAVEMVDRGTAQLAFFLLPTPVTAVLEIADAHDRMPRKSTYFIPKFPTGIVMRSLVP